VVGTEKAANGGKTGTSKLRRMLGSDTGHLERSEADGVQPHAEQVRVAIREKPKDCAERPALAGPLQRLVGRLFKDGSSVKKAICWIKARHDVEFSMPTRARPCPVAAGLVTIMQFGEPGRSPGG